MTQSNAAPNGTPVIQEPNAQYFEELYRFRDVMTRGLAIHGKVALKRHAPATGARVLDIGSAFGDSSIELAHRVGTQGQVVGIDAMSRFVETATREADELGITNVRFVEADAQSADLGSRYDFAFSRFGTLFFANPIGALRNVRRSLAPGAPLCMVVWRKAEDNAAVAVAERIVSQLIPETSHSTISGPGPFSMASADFVSELLLGAAFDRIAFERNDAPICIGRDVDEAVEFAMALGPAGKLLRLAGPEAELHRPKVVTKLRQAFSEFLGPDGVLAPSSTWIVTARAA